MQLKSHITLETAGKKIAHGRNLKLAMAVYETRATEIYNSMHIFFTYEGNTLKKLSLLQ